MGTASEHHRVSFSGSRWHPKTCRRCGRGASTGDLISSRGLCGECGVQTMYENVAQMVAHAGPNFLRWRRGMVASALDPAAVAALDQAGYFT